jgi:opacity protein-like surface antigen
VGYYPWGFANVNLNAPGVGVSTSGTASAPQWLYGVGVRYATADQWSFALGYQWDTISIGSITVPITTGGGQTLGGTVCPCNTSYSGFLFSVGKTF